MSKNVPENCIDLVGTQCGVISRSQALAAGMTRAAIDWRLRAERWSKLGPGVYLVRTGPPTRQAELWRAILQAGPHAALSHQTAAELHKLTDRPSSLIHVTIPGPRRAMPPAGVVVHRSSRLAQAVHPTLQPPRTRIEETVLDLVPLSATSDEALSVICAACQRGLTVPELITQAMTARKKLRWRAELAEALGQISGGVHSLLEYRYLQFVERPHRLPLATGRSNSPTAIRACTSTISIGTTAYASNSTAGRRIRKTDAGTTSAGSMPSPRMASRSCGTAGATSTSALAKRQGK